MSEKTPSRDRQEPKPDDSSVEPRFLSVAKIEKLLNLQVAIDPRRQR